MSAVANQSMGRYRQTRTALAKMPGVIFLVAIHLLPIVALALGYSSSFAAFAAIHVFLAFVVIAGLHRYFAHHSFKTSRVFQFIMGVAAATTFSDPIGFAGKHRLHHKYSDTGKDPHAPGSGFWHCWFGSLLDEGYTDDEVIEAVRDLVKYPELMLLHRLFWVPGILFGATAYALGGFALLALGYCAALALLVNVTSSVNYFCHIAGSRRYATQDGSRNNMVVALFAFGEGWHNNHHHYPTAARAGFFWWEYDPFYWCIRLLAILGIVWDVREVPEHLLRAERRAS